MTKKQTMPNKAANARKTPATLSGGVSKTPTALSGGSSLASRRPRAEDEPGTQAKGASLHSGNSHTNSATESTLSGGSSLASRRPEDEPGTQAKKGKAKGASLHSGNSHTKSATESTLSDDSEANPTRVKMTKETFLMLLDMAKKGIVIEDLAKAKGEKVLSEMRKAMAEEAEDVESDSGSVLSVSALIISHPVMYPLFCTSRSMPNFIHYLVQVFSATLVLAHCLNLALLLLSNTISETRHIFLILIVPRDHDLNITSVSISTHPIT
ncbi:hypothetical protein RSOLAG1IB_03846 [Rhizoctonia solani AG-1 IB]|uniref:Uncharacterized protein n=1 Tax=Thanatephorus cucumeris (strain AG1-IB / isolate 7/3/14) TaxID=1108050 RepID=A0A0B7FWL5_THACB|nr:hypothetical protein RSOLAG1IB_03846 [Rhizoctonia solani AG-1 IB]